jgi:hypothetical protein
VILLSAVTVGILPIDVELEEYGDAVCCTTLEISVLSPVPFSAFLPRSALKAYIFPPPEAVAPGIVIVA